MLSDQDDVWLPNKLEVISEVFENNEKCKGLCTGFEYIDTDGNLIICETKNGYLNNNLIIAERAGLPSGKTLVEIPFELVVEKNISPGMTAAYRREVMDYYLERSLLHFPHDWELNIISAAKGGLYFLDKKLSYYRIHGNQTVSINYMRDPVKRLKTKLSVNQSEAVGRYEILKNVSECHALTDKAEIAVSPNVIADFCDLYSNRVDYLNHKNFSNLMRLKKSQKELGEKYKLRKIDFWVDVVSIVVKI